jgi:tetratricopeptide (TPR) repeat protein
MDPIKNEHPTLLTCEQVGRRKQTVFICLLLALMTAAVYWPVARQGFINFDDPDYVSGNPRVQAGLTRESVQWAFTSFYSSNWHPLTWLSHMLDCQLYGLKPAGHHLTNLLFHIANSLLLFGLLRRMTGTLWRSALVAALFALHPLHVESVAWVSERKDVLSAFFFMLTLWAYASYAKAEGRLRNAESGIQRAAATNTQHATRNTPRASLFHPPSSILYLLSLVFFALGLMSKPMLVTLPFVLLLLDYWPLRRFQLSTLNSQPSTTPLRLVLEKAPFFILSALSCVVTFLVQRACGAMAPLAKTPFDLRLANALVAYARYLGKTLWPSDLAVFYPYSRLSLDSWQVAGAALLLLAATAAVVLARKQRPYLLVGWLWFLGMLVPVIGLVQVGKQSWADRYTYLPHIGLFLLIAWGASAVIARWKWPRLIVIAAAGLTLAACGLVTSRQLAHWRNTQTLFQHAIAVTAENFVAYTVIGNALMEEGKLPEAIEQCRKALEIAPDYSEAHNTLGNIYARQEKYDEAIAHYRAALQADPSYPDPHNGLGNVLLKQGEFAEAEAQCRETLRLAPLHLPAMFCLATALHKQGKLDEAADYYRRILALSPNLFTPRRYLGNILVAQGKPAEAAVQLLLAVKIRPDDADTRTVLGVALLGNNRTDEAAAQLREAARLQPTNSIANYQLALIYQGRKETRAAVECFRKALQAQPDWPESLNNLAWILAANPDATLRNGPEAVALAERACKLTGYKEALLVGTLAAAYAEAGRFPEAMNTAEQARTLALAAGQKEVAQRNQELLELYRAHRAYHETQ